MADAVQTAEPKKKKDEGPVLFGLYQNETGSYTLGDHTFRPLRPLKVPAAVEDTACEETSPVKFFKDEQAATEASAKLKARFDARRKPQPKEE